MKYPWITYKAIRWLDNYLSKDIVMFEYGSGDSTLYFADKVKKIISVEHDKSWYENIHHQLTDSGLKNWDHFYVPAERLKKPSNYSPGSYSSKSSKNNARNLSFEDYVKFIEIYHDHFFDFIFIDGRSRASCILHAIKKVKKGGYVMLDNSDRKHYKCIFPLMEKFEITNFWGPGEDHEHWNTTIWRIE